MRFWFSVVPLKTEKAKCWCWYPNIIEKNFLFLTCSTKKKKIWFVDCFRSNLSDKVMQILRCISLFFKNMILLLLLTFSSTLVCELVQTRYKEKNSSPWGWSNTATGFLERLLSPHACQCSINTWIIIICFEFWLAKLPEVVSKLDLMIFVGPFQLSYFVILFHSILQQMISVVIP